MLCGPMLKNAQFILLEIKILIIMVIQCLSFKKTIKFRICILEVKKSNIGNFTVL